MQYILIADDNKDITDILAAYVRKEGYEPVIAKDGLEAERLFGEYQPMAILLDVMMPVKDGYEVCRSIRRESSVPIILITARGEDYDKIMGLDIGADDYIKKPFSIIEFITRVKAVLRRTLEQPDDKYMTIGDIFLDNERHVVYVDNKGIELTYKEYELLKLLMHNAGIVLTREKIMERVWDTEFEGESRTVDMHIKTLRKKLGDSSRHIKTVRNVGYVME